MIVRISGEDQYRLDGTDAERIGELEGRVTASVERGDGGAYSESFGALLDFVRSHGARVGDDELEGSDLILPPADTTLAEAGREFTGEGLIPD
jgi:hypothetical protein